MQGQSKACPNSQAGFTYLALLVTIAILGVGLSATSEVWTATSQRQKLIQLQWAGDQISQAIGSYYQATPGLAKVYPATMQDLLMDPRYLSTRRHLRSIYVNPFTGQPDWIPILTSDGKIRGVRALLKSDGYESFFDFIYTR
jgi:type II secretory pathway pseudopilin PulG